MYVNVHYENIKYYHYYFMMSLHEKTKQNANKLSRVQKLKFVLFGNLNAS